MRFLLFWFAIACVAACSPADQAASPEARTEIDLALLDADEAWEVLTTHIERLSPIDGIGHLGSFEVALERDRQRFREKGLTFWRTFPDDPRRYDWLIVTTHASPEYPSDFVQWAIEAERLGPNLADRDVEQIQSWDDTYIELRDVFFASGAVTETQRRQLRSAELYQLLKTTRYARQRNEDSMSDDLLIAEAVKFLEAFPKPSTEDDYGALAYAWDRERVMGPLLGWFDLGDTIEQTQLFSDEFRDVDARWYEGFNGIVDDRQYQSRLTQYQLQASYALQDHFTENKLRDWSDWRQSDNDGSSVLNAIYYSSLTFPSSNRETGGIAESAIAFYDIYLSIRRFRELGIAYFDQMPLEDRIEWLEATTWRAPFGMEGGFAFMFRPYSEFPSLGEDVIDLDYLMSSDMKVRAAYDAVLSDPSISTETRATLRDRRLQLGFATASYAWRMRQDRSLVEDKLALIEQLSAVDPAGAARWTARFIRPDNESYERFGLTNADLEAFLAQFLGREDRLGELAESYVQRISLNPGVSISIAVPSLDGERLVRTEDFLGSYLLVDHWDTNCAPCIRDFPEVHEIYEQFKDQGFNVMSIAYDGASERQRVDQIKARLGLTWSTVNGEGLWGAISSRYGVSGFPQYMLLDREGRLIVATDDLRPPSRLREILEREFARERAGAEAPG